ncbi:MAG TPA: hypothetical protein VGM91_19145 [Conexibacter sp.]|jgi:hypothetical protein
MLSPDQRLAVRKAEPIDVIETQVLPGTHGSVCHNLVVPFTVPHGDYEMRSLGVRQIVDVVEFCLN